MKSANLEGNGEKVLAEWMCRERRRSGRSGIVCVKKGKKGTDWPCKGRGHRASPYRAVV